MFRQNLRLLSVLALVFLNLQQRVSAGEELRTPSNSLSVRLPRARLAGDRVDWTEFTAQKSTENPFCGRFLEDVENHLPDCYGCTYRDADQVTWCHETTHGINAHLRMRYGGAGRNAFYVGNDRAAIVDEPRLTIGDVAAAIPADLRGHRFETYLVNQRGSWDFQPLYLWDEWVAYTNGAQTALELVDARSVGRRDYLLGMLEFNVYALYLAKLSQDNGSANQQLVEFFAWNWRRSLKIWEAAKAYDDLNWDNGAYLQRALEHPEIREFLRRNRIPFPAVRTANRD